MSRTTEYEHPLIDAVKEHTGIKHDRELARQLGVQPSCISKIRAGTNKVSAGVIIKIHLLTRVPVQELLDFCKDDAILNWIDD